MNSPETYRILKARDARTRSLQPDELDFDDIIDFVRQKDYYLRSNHPKYRLSEPDKSRHHIRLNQKLLEFYTRLRCTDEPVMNFAWRVDNDESSQLRREQERTMRELTEDERRLLSDTKFRTTFGKLNRELWNALTYRDAHGNNSTIQRLDKAFQDLKKFMEKHFETFDSFEHSKHFGFPTKIPIMEEIREVLERSKGLKRFTEFPDEEDARSELYPVANRLSNRSMRLYEMYNPEFELIERPKGGRRKRTIKRRRTLKRKRRTQRI